MIISSLIISSFLLTSQTSLKGPETIAPVPAPVGSPAITTSVPAEPTGNKIAGSKILSATYKYDATSATAFIVKSVVSLEGLVAGIDKAKGAEAKAKETEIKKLVSGMLDLDTLGQRALITYWDELGKTPKGKKQRDQYITTFKRLVEENYLEKARTYVNGKYLIPLVGEADGKKGKVVTARIKKTDVDLIVEFYVAKTATGWRISDIKLDDTSLEETYRGSFNRIIKKKGGLQTGMPELIAVMERRLDELKKGRATSI